MRPVLTAYFVVLGLAASFFSLGYAAHRALSLDLTRPKPPFWLDLRQR